MQTEKQIGDFTLRVVRESDANGPYSVKIYGGPTPHTLMCRFESEDAAASYLVRVNPSVLNRFFARG
jgi:hypothetical protein